MIVDLLSSVFWWIAAWFGAVSLLSYLVPFVVTNYLLPEQNLASKYNATWAAVTGSSSGIGLAIAKKLAAQVSYNVLRRVVRRPPAPPPRTTSPRANAPQNPRRSDLRAVCLYWLRSMLTVVCVWLLFYPLRTSMCS